MSCFNSLLSRLLGATVLATTISASGTAAQESLPAVDLTEQALETHTIPGEVIVKFREGADRRGFLPALEAQEFGLRAATRTTSGGEVVYQFTTSALLALDSAEALEARVEDIVETLEAREDVEYAQPNYVLVPHLEPNDTHYDKQWHYWTNGSGSGRSPGGIGLPAGWDRTTGTTDVIVAVLDTGSLPNHPDVAGSGNNLPGYDMITDVFMANDGNGRDPDPTDPGDAVAAGECYPGSPARGNSWHGAHVAGTIGAVATNNSLGVAGVGWQVSILPVRVLGKCGGTTVDINDGIRWAAGLPVPGVPANSHPARVINMSLGGRIPCANSPSTQQAIADAIAAGASVVVSAGNSAADAAGFMPASCNGVITVAASDARGHLASRYSNFGAVVDILAPGGDIDRDDNSDGHPDGVLSTVQGGYAFYNGTSMSAPHVSGVAALILADDNSKSPNAVLSTLEAWALPRSNAECPQPCGAGLLAVAFEPEADDPRDARYEYAAKFVCGTREDFREQGSVRYDTIVNIRNPGPEDTEIAKRLELALPPGGQRPGDTHDISSDQLGARQTLASNCEDVIRRVFGGGLPAPFIDGYLVLESPTSLDVTAAYLTDLTTSRGLVGSDIEVESVRERRLAAE